MARFRRPLAKIVIERGRYLAVYCNETKNLAATDRKEVLKLRDEIVRRRSFLVQDGVRAEHFTVDDPLVATRAITGMSSFMWTWAHHLDSNAGAERAKQMSRIAMRMLQARRRDERAQRTIGGPNMSQDLTNTLDRLLAGVVSSSPRVPGVVAMVTDRERTIYEGAAGERVLGEAADMTTDSVFAIFSTTKAITGTAVLQLVEEGKLDLDAPAKTYAPDIGALRVLDGFDGAGKPILRAPKRDITTRMLLLHTAGFGYDFFNESYKRLTHEHGYPGVVSSTKACISTPLLFDPGDAWEYGTSIDWAGQVVEGIAGKRLGTVLQERIFEPLGMNDTRFTMTDSMRARLACIHQRGADGSLNPLVGFELPQDPEIHMGGGGLYGTVGDYCRFMRMWLNDGNGEFGRVLKAETIRMAEKSGLGDIRMKMLPGVIPELSNDAEFFPGEPKSWALTFMVNETDAPTGRPAGSLSWAGLANCFFWVDRKNGVAGYWATQILPFIDGVSYPGYLEFETSVYRSIAAESELAHA